MEPTTELQTQAAQELPTENPDSVIITCPMECATHGWTPGNTYSTDPMYKTIEGARDANGYNIHVMSPLRGRSVWLGSTDYKLNN